jgi:predicted transglutaminase-like cysteine proteinase
MSAPIDLTADRWAELIKVNTEVNALPYKTDMALYGQPEFWAIIGAAGGDCEDFALGKRARLLALGWPIEALRLCTCTAETGEAHAVLSVDAVSGGAPGTWVLDNRFAEVQAWGDLQAYGYRFIERQAAGGPSWVSVA